MGGGGGMRRKGMGGWIDFFFFWGGRQWMNCGMDVMCIYTTHISGVNRVLYDWCERDGKRKMYFCGLG